MHSSAESYAFELRGHRCNLAKGTAINEPLHGATQTGPGQIHSATRWVQSYVASPTAFPPTVVFDGGNVFTLDYVTLCGEIGAGRLLAVPTLRIRSLAEFFLTNVACRITVLLGEFHRFSP
jgi:hypothetical protein